MSYWYHMLTSCYTSQPVHWGRCCTPTFVSVPARGPGLSYCYEYNNCVLLCVYSIRHKPVYNVSYRICPCPWKEGSWGQHRAHLGPTGPRWAPCWPHELCYLGCFVICFVVLWLCCESLVNPCNLFSHILWGCVIGSEVTLNDMGKLTIQNNNKTQQVANSVRMTWNERRMKPKS